MIAQATRTTPRPYVAVNFSFAQDTSTVRCTANKDMVIEGPNGGRIELHAGEKFTVVRAASLGPDMWYIVRDVTGCKKCSCPAMKPCRHEKAVAAAKPDDSKSSQQSVVEFVQASPPQIAAPKLARATLAPVFRPASMPSTAELLKHSTLSSNKGFSLMR